jgi:chromosomal replication initiation ATPase DnaA
MHAPLTCPTCGAPSRPLAMVAHIQATVAGYYRLRATDIVSHRRPVEIVENSQILSKSLPEYGKEHIGNGQEEMAEA